MVLVRLARRPAALPSAVPTGLDISSNVEHGHVAGFHAVYLKWAAALSKRQADALSEPGSVYLPGAHRFPGALVGSRGAAHSAA